MKIIKVIIMASILHGFANAQFALQIGSRQQLIRTGDVLSRQQLMGDTVRLLFVPDSLLPNSGIEGIVVVLGLNNKEAKAFKIIGNILSPAQEKTFQTNLLKANTILIQQVWRKDNRIRPVSISLKLTD
jgi:hypothetical protein